MNLVFDRRATQILMMILMICTSTVCLPLTGRAEGDPADFESLPGMVKHLCRDTKHVLTSPLRWRQNDIALLATLSTATFAVMLVDRDFQNSVQDNRTCTSDRISRWTGRYTQRIVNLTIGGLYLSGLVLHDHKSKETALLCLESVLLAQAVTKALKYVTGRARPYANRGAFSFDPLEFPPSSYSLSFPSGHATAAFALSSVIAERYRSWWVRLISYGFATAVSVSRLNNNVHFPSDVFWGGLVGISVGRCLVRFHERDNTPDFELGFRREPDDTGFGISIWLR
ncbi:MAG: phosphatase PAP2 family protein [candidate division Zixibacteria bacterium]|nr:phosphatase PAP2 family protein [candidate division Zixibacteria bacterium]